MGIILHTKKFIQSQMVFREISPNPFLSHMHQKLSYILRLISGRVGKTEDYDSKVKHIFWLVDGWETFIF